MAKLGDIPREPPKQPEIGTALDWERMEEALGYKGADPEPRQRLCRDLLLITNLYFGPGGRLPEVRARNVDRALDVLRGHAAALQAHLWWGRTPKVGSFEDLLKPPDSRRSRRMTGLATWIAGRCFTSAPKFSPRKAGSPPRRVGRADRRR